MSFEIGGSSSKVNPNGDNSNPNHIPRMNTVRGEIRKNFERIETMADEIIRYKEERIDYLKTQMEIILKLTTVRKNALGNLYQPNPHIVENLEKFMIEFRSTRDNDLAVMNTFKDGLQKKQVSLTDELQNGNFETLMALNEKYKTAAQNLRPIFQKAATIVPPDGRSLSTLYKNALNKAAKDREFYEGFTKELEQATGEIQELEEASETLASLMNDEAAPP